MQHMMKIGLLSDTHGYVHPRIKHHFKEVDEIWHAGDIGSIEVLEELEQFKKVRAVYGNIDNHKIRAATKEHRRFVVEGIDVWITHIGGYPGRYAPQIREYVYRNPPNLFICGHSHILKIMRDKRTGLLHMNPGACGKSGFHKVKTLIRFELNRGQILNPEVIELGDEKSE